MNSYGNATDHQPFRKIFVRKRCPRGGWVAIPPSHTCATATATRQQNDVNMCSFVLMREFSGSRHYVHEAHLSHRPVIDVGKLDVGDVGMGGVSTLEILRK